MSASSSRALLMSDSSYDRPLSTPAALYEEFRNNSSRRGPYVEGEASSSLSRRSSSFSSCCSDSAFENRSFFMSSEPSYGTGSVFSETASWGAIDRWENCGEGQAPSRKTEVINEGPEYKSMPLASVFASALKNLAPPSAKRETVVKQTVYVKAPRLQGNDNSFLTGLVHALATTLADKTTTSIEDKERAVQNWTVQGKLNRRKRYMKKWKEKLSKEYKEKKDLLEAKYKIWKAELPLSKANRLLQEEKEKIEDGLNNSLKTIQRVEDGDLQIIISPDGTLEKEEISLVKEEKEGQVMLIPEHMMKENKGKKQVTFQPHIWLEPSIEEKCDKLEDNPMPMLRSMIGGGRQKKRKRTENDNQDEAILEEGFIEKFRDIGKGATESALENLDKVEETITNLVICTDQDSHPKINWTEMRELLNSLRVIRSNVTSLALEVTRCGAELCAKATEIELNKKFYYDPNKTTPPSETSPLETNISGKTALPVSNSSREKMKDEKIGPVEGTYAGVIRKNINSNAAIEPRSDLPRQGKKKLPPLPRVKPRDIDLNKSVVIELLDCPTKENDTSETVLQTNRLRKKILTELKPKLSGIKVCNMYAKRKGIAFALECDTVDDRDKILNFQSLSDLGLSAKVPEEQGETIVIIGVDSSLSKEELKEDIYRQNIMKMEQFKNNPEIINKITPQFTIPCKWIKGGNFVRWVIQVPKDVKEAILERGEILIEWSKLKVKNYIWVTRCLKCLRVGHSTAECLAKEKVCGHCSREGHLYKDCTDKAAGKKASCGPCREAKRESDHSIRDSVCPFYLREVDKVKNRN